MVRNLLKKSGENQGILNVQLTQTSWFWLKYVSPEPFEFLLNFYGIKKEQTCWILHQYAVFIMQYNHSSKPMSIIQYDDYDIINVSLSIIQYDEFKHTRIWAEKKVTLYDEIRRTVWSSSSYPMEGFLEKWGSFVIYIYAWVLINFDPLCVVVARSKCYYRDGNALSQTEDLWNQSVSNGRKCNSHSYFMQFYSLLVLVQRNISLDTAADVWFCLLEAG